MDLTVRAMLDLEVLESLVVLAGHHGLDKEVKNITFLDAPDAIKWIRGNEFVITTLYLFRDVNAQLDLIQHLADSNVSALGIKQNRFVYELTPEVLAMADKVSLPLLRIPYEKAWVDLINPVMAELLNRQLVILEKSNVIRRLFTREILDGGNLQSIAGLLSRLTGNPITILELINKTVTNWPSSFRHQICSDTLMAMRTDCTTIVNECNNIEGMIVPIEVAKQTEGFIVIWKTRELNNLDLEAIEQATTGSALYIQKLKAVNEINQRFKDGFISQILQGEFSSVYIRGKAKEMGWTLYDRNQVVVVQSGESDWGRSYEVFNYFKNILKGKYEILMGMEGNKNIVFIVPWTREQDMNEEIRELLVLARKRLIEKNPTLIIGLGIGRVHSSLESIGQSFEEALVACRVSMALKKPCTYDTIGSYSLLIELLKFNETNVYLKELVYPILVHDRENNGELFKTLEVFINTNCNYRETGKKMNVHHNTIRYRLGVLENILAIDLKDPDVILNMMLAIKLHSLKIHPPHNPDH